MITKGCRVGRVHADGEDFWPEEANIYEANVRTQRQKPTLVEELRVYTTEEIADKAEVCSKVEKEEGAVYLGGTPGKAINGVKIYVDCKDCVGRRKD